VPPDLPPEYADAYRKAYERAYRQAAGSAVDEDQHDAAAAASRPGDATFEPDRADHVEHRISGPLFADEILDVPTPSPVRGGSHRADTPTSLPVPSAPGERPAWLVPAILAGLVVVLLIAAYGIGRVVSSSMADSSAKPKAPASVVMTEDGASPSAGASSSPSAAAPPSKKKSASAKKYTGPTTQARVTGASASCEASSSVDSGGHRVSYGPSNVFDGDLTTAWRCDGRGTGDTVHLALAGPTRIGEIGLVPGYAKTDPASGTDRYRQNNRITRVEWRFSDGTTVRQTFDPSPSRRTVQTMRIPVVRADGVEISVLSSVRGPRDTIAVSEVRLGRVG
jgi:hypothetical protein